MKTFFAVIISVLLGTISFGDWASIFALGFAGALIYKLVSYTNTGQRSNYSPSTFNLKYWIEDRGNWNDLLLGLLLFFFISRFKAEFIQAFSENVLVKFLAPYTASPFFYLILGFLMTFIIKKVRSWTQAEQKKTDQ